MPCINPVSAGETIVAAATIAGGWRNEKGSGVRAEGIYKRFGETHALVDASIYASPGQIHAIVGENGSGKSTLAKVLAGVLIPDKGTVDVFGTMPASPAQALSAGVATIFQEILVADGLSVSDNVFAGHDSFWLNRMSETEKREQTGEIMQRLAGVPVDPKATVGSLPLAIKQWVVIARALLRKPQALIFDESSAALDLDATLRLHDEMRRLRSNGCTILLVTHRIAELVKIADAATVLRDGTTVARLVGEEVTEDAILRFMSAQSERVHSSPDLRAGLHGDTLIEAAEIAVRPGSTPFSFELRAGEIVGLAGLDGGGQLELVHALAGIAAVDKGEVLAQGKSVLTVSDAGRAGIAYVSGDRKREGIFPRHSIIENFGLALMQRQSRAGFIDRRIRQTAFRAWTAKLGLKFGHVGDRITSLSGGNQQKVLIARALAMSPRVIVLNDPARGVDIGTKQELWRHLKAFVAQGGAVAYLSSEIEEFPGFASRVDVFADGNLQERLSGVLINENRILNAMFGRAVDHKEQTQ